MYCILSVIFFVCVFVYLVDIMCRWVKDWLINVLCEFLVICVKILENVVCVMYFFFN